MRRRLVLLLCLLLTPVLVFTSQGIAQAVVAHGSTADASFGHTWIAGTDKFNCTVRGQWWTDSTAGTLASTLHYSWTCSEGAWDTGFSVGLSVPRTECATASPLGLLASFTNGGMPAQHGLSGSGVFVPSVDPTTVCTVATLCLSIDIGNNPPLSDHSYTDCQPWNVGTPPGSPVSTSCTKGSPDTPVIGANEKIVRGDGYRYWSTHLSFGVNATTTNDWWPYVVVRTSAGDFAYTPTGGTDLSNIGGSLNATGNPLAIGTKAFSATSGVHSTWDYSVETGTAWYWPSDPGPAGPDGTIIGAGIIGTPSTPYPTHEHVPYSGSFPSGQFGITNPSACTWYWGTKIADLTGTTDDPAGVLGGAADPGDGTATPPTAVTGGCDFSISDPDTWLSGGMCAATGLLGAILQAIRDVASALLNLASAITGPIVDALAHLLDNLGSLLQALFVPDTAAWHFSDLQDQWNSRPPGSILNASVGAVTGVADGLHAGGSCSLAPWVVKARGVSYSQDQVCPKSYPAYLAVYELVAAGFLVLTGIYSFRLIRSAVGSGGGGS